MSSTINKSELITKLQTIEGLTNEERSNLIGLLRQHKKYGLVWEDKPEDVEERLREILPVLRDVKDKAILSDNPDAPNHILIEGDNLEALTALSYTHEGKIDVIYIDPPYNTGNKDFVYNDSFVDSEDSYRHSKWLSFMNKRLKIAKKLLSDKGVIFISIDDNEQANLKLLCDGVFGEKNFVASLIWRGGKRNMSKWISTSHEYMLLYANNLSYCAEIGVEWNEKKQGINEIYSNAKRFVRESNGNFEVASSRLKDWFKELPDSNPSKDHKHYCWIDEKGVYFASDISRGGGGGPKWEITNPYTGEVVKTPQRGWAYSTLEELQDDIKSGIVHFNGAGVPCKKRYLKENETQILDTVFYKDRRGSSKRLRELLGGDLFPFPKDENILTDKFKSFSSKDSTILDFFAGSGTTLHATMQLNAEDGGHRQCILVTNNENNICEEVTYERNKRVINGYTTPKGVEVAGLKANTLRYYKTDFISRDRTQKNMRELMSAATDLLCIKENLYEEQKTFGRFKLKPHLARYFNDGRKHMLIVYREELIDEIAAEIKTMDFGKMRLKIYVFSPGRYAFTDNFSEVEDKVELVALPAAIYDAYQKVLPKRKEKLFEEEKEVNAAPISQDLFAEQKEGGES